jgi:hypothetical protein
MKLFNRDKIEKVEYTAKEMSDEYRLGYINGYNAGFMDGKEACNKVDERKDVG